MCCVGRKQLTDDNIYIHILQVYILSRSENRNLVFFHFNPVQLFEHIVSCCMIIQLRGKKIHCSTTRLPEVTSYDRFSIRLIVLGVSISCAFEIQTGIYSGKYQTCEYLKKYIYLYCAFRRDLHIRRIKPTYTFDRFRWQYAVHKYRTQIRNVFIGMDFTVVYTILWYTRIDDFFSFGKKSRYDFVYRTCPFKTQQF